jgi:hypothetical protein
MPTDTVVLNNDAWTQVYVEAQKGMNATPGQNASLGTRTLALNDQWTIPSDGDSVWYRRDADPDNHNGQLTPWVEQPCYATGQTYTIDLSLT